MKHVSLTAIALCCGLQANAQTTISDFVYANTLHTLFHELGHALISEFQLPVLGQEEDAVDTFATIEVINYFSADAEWLLTDVALAWLISHDTIAPEDQHYYGEHDLDAQRAYRTICHLYGADPDAFEDAADWIELPEDYRDTCAEMSPLAVDAWNVLLDAMGALRDTDAPAQEINLVYDDHPLKDALIQNGALDWIRSYAIENFSWPKPLTFRAETCEEANAYWDPNNRTMSLCYELIEDWIGMEKTVE